MNTQPERRLCTISDLPLELILDSLSRIDYTPRCLHALRPVCRNFDKLLRHFEHSLAVQVIRLQFPPGILAKHPGLYDSDTRIGFNTLDELYIRLQTLFRIERNCHSIRRREGKEAAWMRPEWIDLHQTGMHLLHRLYDAGKSSTDQDNQTVSSHLDRRPRRQGPHHSIVTSHLACYPLTYSPSLHPPTPCRRPPSSHPNITTSAWNATFRSRTLLPGTYTPTWTKLFGYFAMPLSPRHQTSRDRSQKH